MHKILVVDDHSVVRQGIIRILEESSELDLHCEEAATSHQALEKLSAGQYHAALLDISLNGENGLDLLCQMRLSQPNLPILIVSMHPEEQFAVHVISLGAVGYLPKHSAPSVIVAAVRKVLAGGRYVSDYLADHLAEQVANSGKIALAPHEKLSTRELQILIKIGSGKTPTEMAAALCLSVKTISTYRSRVLKKMELKTSAELMKYAIAHNLAE